MSEAPDAGVTTTEATRSQGRYFAALDGLRAVAVCVVLLYHGGSAWLPGGFLGVDMFFVLSGFLITGLLIREWEERSALDLRRFWTHRARRLLPALLLVLVATVIMAVIIGGPLAATVRSDGLASLFYVSNWWFIAQGASYEAAYEVPSPLQHTWSLAIEEQWYLLLPLALLLFLPRLGLNRSRLALVLVGLALASAAWMAVLAPAPGADPSRDYFGTDTRIQALLIGGALACAAPLLSRSRATAAAAIGGALLLVAALLSVEFETSWLYRGGFLIVAVAVALVIADVTARPQGVLARMLSVPPLVAIGKISYGLYLWHWPVYIFVSGARVGLSGASLLLVRLAITFALAIASYFLIERPIRRGALGRMSQGRRWTIVVGSVGGVVALLLLAPLLAGPTTPAVGAAPDPAAQAARQEAQAARQGSPRVAVLGDSQVLALTDQYPNEMTGLDVLPVLQFGCGVVPYDASIDGKQMTLPEECYGWADGYRTKLAAADADVGVLLAGSWEQYDRWTPDGTIPYTDPRWSDLLEEGYSQRLQALHETTDEVVLVLNHCHGVPDWDLPLGTQFRAGRYPPVVNDPARIAAVNEAASAAAAAQDFPVKVVDLNPLLCADGYQERVAGVDVRTDGLHFSEPGARLVWQDLDPALRRLAADS